MASVEIDELKVISDELDKLRCFLALTGIQPSDNDGPAGSAPTSHVVEVLDVDQRFNLGLLPALPWTGQVNIIARDGSDFLNRVTEFVEKIENKTRNAQNRKPPSFDTHRRWIDRLSQLYDEQAATHEMPAVHALFTESKFVAEELIIIDNSDWDDRKAQVAQGLAVCALEIFERTNEVEYLDESVAWSTLACRRARSDSIRIGSSIARANSLSRRYFYDRRLYDLLASSVECDAALGLIDPTVASDKYSALALCRGKVSEYLFRESGSVHYIDSGIEILKSAASLEEEGSERRGGLLHHHSNALQARYQVMQSQNDAMGVLKSGRESVAAVGTASKRALRCATFLNALVRAHEADVGLEWDVDELDIRTSQVLDAVDKHDPNYLWLVSTVAESRVAASRAVKVDLGLESVAAQLEEGLQSSTDKASGNSNGYLLQLADTRVALIELGRLKCNSTNAQAALLELKALRSAVPEHSPIAWLSSRSLLRLRRAESAKRSIIVSLLQELVTNRSGPMSERVTLLQELSEETVAEGSPGQFAVLGDVAADLARRSRWSTLAPDIRFSSAHAISAVLLVVALFLARAGSYDLAAQRFDESRNMLFRARVDPDAIERIRAQNPARAAELELILAKLSSSGFGRTDHKGGVSFINSPEREEEIAEYWKRWDVLIGDDRQAARLEESIATIAKQHLLVRLVVTRFGSGLLYRMPERNEYYYVDVPKVSTTQLQHLWKQYQAGEIEPVLRYLWDEIINHIAFLGSTSEPTPIWWYPSSYAASLPLHAARACSAAAAEKDALLIFQSSYFVTPEIPSDAKGCDHGTYLTDAPELSVGMSMAPSWLGDDRTALTYVGEEMSHLRQHGCQNMLENGAATLEATTSAVSGARSVHFSCHAKVVNEKPAISGMVLSDGMLSLEQILELPHASRSLAFLNACETAQVFEDFPDVGLTIAASFANVGFRHVIATMKAVLDSTAFEMTKAFYAALEDSQDPSVALRHAMIEVRSLGCTTPSWVHYCHVGV
ncbi:CHAT domain-containing protein [Arthrobacter sp. Leaf234]|uniref:CHAT domain-containing protein n=1 Tax=Arthrobacter sp. Leaf234 TaxID=1736303 RepID=UPI00138F24F3|nr:CHAT domain-containing protein [Arthrobacter sp. Leaf234]